MTEELFEKLLPNIITASCGLFGVLIGGGITYIINRTITNRQIEIQLATTIHREWIDTMRRNFAQTLQIAHEISVERQITNTNGFAIPEKTGKTGFLN
jgi:predicted DNA-binding protein (UPF0278 family)